MLRRAANLIAAIAVMALAFLGMVKAGGWYLDTEEQQVRCFYPRKEERRANLK